MEELLSNLPDTVVAPADSLPAPTPVSAFDNNPSIDMRTMTSLPPAWLDGIEPEPRPGHTGHDQGVVALIVMLLLAMSLSFRNIRRVWGTLVKRLWNTHARQGFEHITMNEKRTIGLLLIVAVFFIALLSTAALSSFMPGTFHYTIATTLRLTALVALYFMFQYAVYEIIGYTFVSDEGRQMWVEGFTASMTLLGVLLTIPGLAVLFYPDITVPMVELAAALYVIARIMFICKGFRIFYTNSWSLVYFILYLCSLELIPVILIFHLACIFCS